MAIDRAQAARIAELARLAVSEDELSRAAEQVSQVLEFVAALDQLELAASEPASLAPADAPLRADAPDGRTLDAERATANAPAAEHGYFLVPPVVENLTP